MHGARNLLQLSDHVSERTRRRLGGLTDDEYLWEPAPDCWSVRVGADGVARADGAPRPGAPPFTTAAWRLWHLTSCYGEARNERWLRGGDDGGEPARCAPRATAPEALAALAAAHDWWRALLASLSESDLDEPLGPIAGAYGRADKAGFVLHMIDEFIHHGAELALLRDLHVALGR